ncbi:hypothetical protein HDU79_000242 [Rhizoclosmatium sp. JEL0117]|nr:hypothetical protein HDU79_000242 [Rhizoclosmatium sp. JEL0117]
MDAANQVPEIHITITSKVLGRGCYGTVYAGKYETTDVAIKTFTRIQAVSSELIRDIQEAVIWHSLRHPNIVTLWGIARTEMGQPMLVVDRLEMTLDERLRLSPVPTQEERTQWLLNIAYAFKYLHSRNPPVIHRDLKLDNVLLGGVHYICFNRSNRLTQILLLDGKGKACISDFGMSRFHANYSYAASRDPTRGAYLFAPPESHQRGYIATPKYDVYSWAMTAYEVLTRHRPFIGEESANEPQTVINWIINRQRPHRTGAQCHDPPADTMSDGLWRLIEKCWDQNPSIRPGFDEIVNTLETLSMSQSSEGDFSTAPVRENNDGSRFSQIPSTKDPSTEEIHILHVEETIPVQNEFDSGPVNHAKVAAQLQLGLCYYLGKGVTKNLREAINVFHLIAKQGNADAQYYLGICHLDSVNIVEAVKWLRLSVKNGHSGAQYRLGVCCLNGLGIERNEVEAFRLLTLSSSQGNEDAQYQLGMCHLNGIGVQANFIEAVKWFRQASDKGHTEARYQMGVCFFNKLDVENNMELARKWFQLSRNSESLYYLGLCSCIENDFATAAKYFRASAEKGNAMAQYRFGLCYYKGRGVKKDLLDAFKWFHMSATQGNDSAQYWLGMCYYNGHGVQKDLKEAVVA